MKKHIKDSLKFVLFLSVGIFFIWFSLKDLSVEERFDILTYAKEAIHNGWIYLVLCMFIGFLSVVFRGLRSVLMIEPLGHKISKTNSYHAAMIGYFANLAFPRLGEVLRCTILQKYEKVPFQKSLGTVITERIIDTLLFGVLFLVALVLESEKLVSIFVENNVGGKIITMASGAGKYIAVGGIVGLIVLLYVFRKKIAKWIIYKKVIKILSGFWEGLVSIKDLKHPFLFIVYSLLIWLCYYLMFYICTFAFPFLTTLGIKSVLLASLSCVVIGTLGFVVAQGGLGVYPMLVYIALHLYGISETGSKSIGWVVWSTETLMYIVLGLASLLIISFKKDKTKTEPHGLYN